MKKLFAFVFCIILSLNVAFAEIDIASMTDEELYDLRQAINDELGSRLEGSLALKEGTTIAELFPDTALAKKVRDAVGAFSTKDVITQEKLDKITQISFTAGDGLTSLEGIQYLHNLNYLSCFNQKGLIKIPDSIGSLTKLEKLYLELCPIEQLPDSICDLPLLKLLNLHRTNIVQLPADIGNLSNLKTLDISNTRISELPESIYLLQLSSFNRDGLDLD